MFSCKTTRLLEAAERATRGGYTVAAVKHAIDKRFDVEGEESKVTSHAQLSRTADVTTDDLILALRHPKVILADVVVIDEGQFFKNLVEGATKLRGLGKRVVVAALSGTSERKPWENVAALIAVADDIQFLKAVCSCGNDAPFSQRLTEDTDQVVVGGANEYAPRCNACFETASEEDEEGEGEEG